MAVCMLNAIWKFTLLCRRPHKESGEARVAIYRADAAILEASCRQVLAEHAGSSVTMMSEIVRKQYGDPHAQLIGTNIPSSIRELDPAEISVENNIVMIKMRPHSRDRLIYTPDTSKSYGVTHLTNGLWYFDAERDSQIKDQVANQAMQADGATAPRPDR